MFADGDLPRQAYKFPSSKGVCGFLETVTCAGARATIYGKSRNRPHRMHDNRIASVGALNPVIPASREEKP